MYTVTLLSNKKTTAGQYKITLKCHMDPGACEAMEQKLLVGLAGLSTIPNKMTKCCQQVKAQSHSLAHSKPPS